METKHLPGPWTIEPLRSKHYGTIVRLDKNHTLEVWVGGELKPSEREIDGGWTPECGFDHVETETDLATARLIAAAPDLLAALEFAVKLLGSFVAVSGTAQVEHMRAVIAKARGG